SPATAVSPPSSAQHTKPTCTTWFKLRVSPQADGPRFQSRGSDSPPCRHCPGILRLREVMVCGAITASPGGPAKLNLPGHNRPASHGRAVIEISRVVTIRSDVVTRLCL